MWKSFADEWQAALDGVGLKEFHMWKCERGDEGGFETLTSHQRLMLCQTLVGIVRRHEPHCIMAEMSSVAFREVILKNLRPRGRLRKRT
jgi:hypothetical protein